MFVPKVMLFLGLPVMQQGNLVAALTSHGEDCHPFCSCYFQYNAIVISRQLSGGLKLRVQCWNPKDREP